MFNFTGRLSLGMVVMTKPEGYGFIKDLDTGEDLFFHPADHGTILSAGERDIWPVVRQRSPWEPYGDMPKEGDIIRFSPSFEAEKGPRAAVWVTNVAYLAMKQTMRDHVALMRQLFDTPMQSPLTVMLRDVG